MAEKPVKRGDAAGSVVETDVQAFLQQVERAPSPRAGGGRLIFAMDATASREPSWQQARAIQARMFEQTIALGGLRVQLCFYRGMAECRHSGWIDQPEELARLMAAVQCQAGLTQVRRVLQHAIDEAGRQPVQALVLVVDCMEEDPDKLAGLAGQLGLLRLPLSLFQEGFDAGAERCYRELARLSGGAFSRFDADSPEQLRQLLTAVAVYAAGGCSALKALADQHGGVAGLLSQQLQ